MPARTNIELVLDASSHMQAPYDNQTRFDIAKEELLNNLRPWSDNDVLGFRVFGHRFGVEDEKTCDDTKSLIELDYENVAAIKKALKGLKPKGGKALLGKALTEAMSEFNDVERFPPGKTKQTIIVITSGKDDCNPAYVRTVQKKLAYFPHLNIEYKLIGFGVEKVREAQRIQELANILAGKAYFASNQEELNRLLKIFLIQEPFLNNNRELLDALNGLAKNLDMATQALNAKQLEKAEERISKSEVYFGQTKILFLELESRQYNDTAREVIELIRVMREDQRNGLSIVQQLEPLIPLEGDPQKIDQYNRLVSRYNQVAEEFKSRQRQMESLLRNL